MAVPKSVVKVKKNGVEYVSNVEFAKYSIAELNRAALRDVAKLVRRRCKDECPVKTGTLKKNIATWVRKLKDSQVKLELGVYSQGIAKKKGIPPAPHAHLVMFGHKQADGKTVAGKNFLKNPTYNNVSEIVKIETQYLGHLNEGEDEILGVIDETNDTDDNS